jgi:ATP-binding cassette, subfamily C, bacterial CydCD
MNIHRRLFYFTRGSRLALAGSLLAAFCSALLVIAWAGLLSRILARVVLDGQPLSGVMGWMWALLGVILLRALLALGGEIAAGDVAARGKSALRERLVAHLCALGPRFTRGERTGELAAVITDGVEALGAYYAQYLPQLVLGVVIPLAFLIVVFSVDPLTGVVLLITAPLLPFFLWLTGKETQRKTRSQWEKMSRLSAHFLDSLQGLTTLKIFGRSRSRIREIQLTSAQYRDATLDVMRWGFLSAMTLELVASIATAVVAVEVGLRLLYFQMDFAPAFFLLILTPEFFLPLRNLGTRFHAGATGTAAAKRAFAILDVPSPPLPMEEAVRFDVGTEPFRLESLALEEVGFKYPSGDFWALRKVNLSLRAGEHIALVGYSGAGKSSLADLLLRFSEPTTGRILANGISLNRLDPDMWRSCIAWMPPRPYIFHDSVAANIRLANPKATGRDVAAAARQACLHDFIHSLSDGYDSIIGEGGARLSDGQAQRLALARVILKDAPLLLLDEPTSYLDAATEQSLSESLARFAADRMTITMAHRMRTVQRADRIYFFQNGRIIDEGTHPALMRRNGAYAAFVRAFDSRPAARAEPAADGRERTAIQPPMPEEGSPVTPFRDAQAVGVVRRLISFTRPSLGWIALAVVLGALTVGSNASLMGLSAYLLSAAAMHPSIAELEVAIVGVRFFGISRGIFRYLERLVTHRVNLEILSQLRVWSFRTLEPLAPARLIPFRTGDLLHRVVADINVLENFFARVIAPPAVALVVGIGMGFIVYGFSPTLGLAFLAAWILPAIAAPAVLFVMGRKPGAEVGSRYAELRIGLVDGVQGMADIMAFGRVRDRLMEIAFANRRFAQAQRRLNLVGGVQSSLAVLFANLALWAMLYASIPLVGAGLLAGIALAALALAVSASWEAVLPVFSAAQALVTCWPAAQRLFSLADVVPEVMDPPIPARIPARYGLSVRHLRFTYPGGDRPALDGVSFDLPEGGRLAVVGPSGSGKSTLARLLLRLWEYAEGTIELGGRDLRQWAQEDVRRRFGFVSPHGYFFHGTIMENLRLARPEAAREEIFRAARTAGIHAAISRLPDGYETCLGEQGARLSSGERQRLAIARALLANAPILILDEPTAHLDAPTEKKILEGLFDRLHGRTVLHITHRLVALESFDEILVLEQGRIVARGGHADLIKRDGWYRRLANIQHRARPNA